MKSLRKLNFFRHNKHPKEDKENHDENHPVRFDDHQDVPKSQPLRKSLKRRTSLTELNPYSAEVAQPRKHRPVQSCFEGGVGDRRKEYPSSSDEDTLVSQKTSYRRPPPKKTVQFQQRKMQIDYCGMQTSSEYGSGGPSPINEHLTFVSHFDNNSEYSHGSDYWKRKYRHYKDMCRGLKLENMKLMERLADKTRLYDYVNEEKMNIEKQNRELRNQVLTLQSQLQIFERNQFMPPSSVYPMHHGFPYNQFNNNNNQHCGAGEKLASKAVLPGFAGSLISSSSHGNNNIAQIEEDETKNFRNASDQSSSDDPFGNNVSYLSSSTEEARGESKFVSPLRHDRSSSLTILQDDGYSSHGTVTHSNQTLTSENAELKISPNIETTPVKVVRRRVRFNSN